MKRTIFFRKKIKGLYFCSRTMSTFFPQNSHLKQGSKLGTTNLLVSLTGLGTNQNKLQSFPQQTMHAKGTLWSNVMYLRSMCLKHALTWSGFNCSSTIIVINYRYVLSVYYMQNRVGVYMTVNACAVSATDLQHTVVSYLQLEPTQQLQ